MAHLISSIRGNLFEISRAVKRESPPKPAGSTTAMPSATPNDPPSFLNNFHTALGQAPAPAPAAAPAAPGPPSLESVFGTNPWLTAPVGMAPNGVTFAYNPIFFATPQTAATVAQMIGGSVVQSNAFTPNGGPFQQQQANWMVQLPDGRLVNPGLVASCYSHGYPQSMVDQMVATIVQNS